MPPFQKGGSMTLRTVFRRGTAMAVGVLLVLLASAGGSAGANDRVIYYLQGTISAPQGTRLDQLQVHVRGTQGGFNDPVPVDKSGRFRCSYYGTGLAVIKVLAGGTGLAGADGRINIRNTSTGSVQAVVDVVGYIRG